MHTRPVFNLRSISSILPIKALPDDISRTAVFQIRRVILKCLISQPARKYTTQNLIREITSIPIVNLIYREYL